MQEAKDRNFTARLSIGLLRRLKQRAAAEGVSMNAYLERVLAKALSGNLDESQRAAARRLLAHAKDGVYEMHRPLTREQAHDRHA